MPISPSFSAVQGFNPPPALWMMTVNNNQFNNAGSSMYMGGGTGNPYNTTWASWYPGVGDFCIETWSYFSGTQTLSTIWTLGGTNISYDADLAIGLLNASPTFGGDGVNWQLVVSMQGASTAYGTVVNAGTADPLTGTFITKNTWNHLAATRRNGRLFLYVNGQIVFTTPYSASITNPSGTGATIGMFGVQAVSRYNGGNTQYNFTGYTRNTRYTVNSAVYTGPFTPPNIANFLPPLNGTYFKIAPMCNSGDIANDPGNPTFGAYSFTNELNALSANYSITTSSASDQGDLSNYGPGLAYYSAT